jgi:hypothetical protein
MKSTLKYTRINQEDLIDRESEGGDENSDDVRDVRDVRDVLLGSAALLEAEIDIILAIRMAFECQSLLTVRLEDKIR